MDFKLFLTVFATVFLAEIGDKTQLATVLFSADRSVSLTTVFIGSSLALVLSSAIGVVAGGTVARYVDPKVLHWVAGVGFVIIGGWTIWRA